MEIFDNNILKSRLRTQKARMLALEFCYFSFYLYKNALSITNANRKKLLFRFKTSQSFRRRESSWLLGIVGPHFFQSLLVVLLCKSHVPQKLGINPLQRFISLGSGFLDTISVPFARLVVSGVILGLGHD